MPRLEPIKEPAPQIDIVDQIIIGFDDKRLRDLSAKAVEERIASVLSGLEGFGATVVNQLVIPPNKHAFFAIALIGLRGRTLDELREELKKPAYADVGWIEPNAPIATAGYDDPLLTQQWALDTLGAADPWTVSPPAGNPKTFVAIVDSGLRRPDGGLPADIGQVEPVSVCQTPFFFPHGLDRDGHGTFLAGTIAAVPGNGTGISSPIMPGWNIYLLPVKFFSPAAPPSAANAAFAIVLAALALCQPFQPQRKVINVSWHVAPGDAGLATLRIALDIAVNLLGCLVVFAAGNDGTDNEIFPLYPARFASEPAFQGKVLTALATDRYDAKTFFSNYGRNTVDLGAPGLRILSTARYLVAPPRYAQYSGTSAAAAYVSSGAALVLALHPPNWNGGGAPAWTPQDAVQHLKASADTIEDLKLACIDGKRLNIGRAVYGPVRVTAPGPGAALAVNAFHDIAWSLKYDNPKLQHVRIDYAVMANGPYAPVATNVPIGASPYTLWKPTMTTPGARIRVTPLEGNFPATSDLFRVV
jgi:subtilisin family serine protease